ncbi:MAG: sugar nucleotide-binding protein [Nanoarchaeota archaeon]
MAGNDRILIFGAGYVAGKFADHFSGSALKDKPACLITKADIADPVQVDKSISEFKPSIAINCAGKTGRPNIDWCEDGSFDRSKGQSWLDSNRGQTWRSNVLGPQILAERCQKAGVFLAHVGSGCVYEGDNKGKGFAEDDEPNFFGSFYSRTKILSEKSLSMMSEKDGAKVLQLRLRMPLDSMPGPRNFITKIASYKQVISIPNSISVMDDFVNASSALIAMRATGIYNVVNPNPITHAQILDLYKEIVDKDFKYEIISLDKLHSMTAAKRSNCVLSTRKLEIKLREAGIVMPPVIEAVRGALLKYAGFS